MKLNKNKKIFFVSMALLSSLGMSAANQFVSFQKGDLLINRDNKVEIYMDANDCKGVSYAANALVKDIMKVSGSKAILTSDAGLKDKNTTRKDAADKNAASKPTILVGTIGHSAAIDQLIRQKRINGNLLKGKREKFIITVVDGQLVIAGSDRRGTIYGIYELSQQMGVSPWYDWADVPVEHHDSIFVNKGVYTDGEPAVRYRGIFLNDEAPCLTSWVKNTYGTGYGDHRFYQRVFELVLRLRGNMMWPAMWGWAFYADDPENEKTADEMGVVMSTSHHEPMARNHQEYARNRKGWGPWNYQKNKENLQKFFREGIERMKGTEQIVTIGMRGDGDEAMSDEADTRLMTNIINDQRKIIADVTGKKASETPQVWALYKEVLDYYDKGMKVPDDVTLLLCDDNWGNVRRVPNAKERKHKGGWGLYYHVDYVGAPRNSKMLNVTPVQNPWEQLTLAYENGIDRLWILNVGDLKPMEYPIQLFMDMAWNPNANEFKVDNNNVVSALTQHTRNFCAEQFGEDQADEAARILNMTCKLNGRSTAEMLDASVYNVESGEWQTVVDEYKDLEIAALRQYSALSAEYKDAYFEAILFPVQLMANLHQMYYAQAMNQMLAKKGDAAMNYWADLCEKCFKRDSELMAKYNKEIAGGKWNGMMTQKHIGYTSWNDDFKHDTMPKVERMNNVQNVFDADGNGYIAMEAEHYNSKTDAAQAKWTVIPFMGRTESAMTLMPQTADVKGASLTYKFQAPEDANKAVKVHIVTKSTLDFLNKGGMTYSVSLDGGKAETVNFNGDMNEKPENIYDKYYPTIARRVIEKVVTLDLGNADSGTHTLTFAPNDPAIVLEKIIIDFGGYTKQYLFGKESRRR